MKAKNDVNGKEIHEGDIIERSLSGASPNTIDIVHLKNGQLVIGTGDFVKSIHNFCSLKVIGNIHKNPELVFEK